MCLHEVESLFGDDAYFVSATNGLREGVDVLVTDFLVNHGREQASSESRVVGLFGDQTRGGADRQLVKFKTG